MGLLGLGSYDVLLQGRGGAPILDVLLPSDLTFQRRLDEVSMATATVGAGSPCLGQVDAWKHELCVLRDGEEVWVGPLISPQFERGVVTLSANDVFFWFERRVLDRQDFRFTEVDAGEIFASIAGDALARDNSAGIVIAASSTGVLSTRTYMAAERRRAADVLRELSRTAVDFTAIGRTVRCGGRVVPATVSFNLIDDTLLSPKLSVLGEDAATEVTVLGANQGSTAISGTVGGTTAEYGLVQQSFNEATIEDLTSAGVAAGTRWEFLHQPPVSLSGVLSPDAPVDFADLVPGARVKVELTQLDRQVDDDFRLAQVEVSVRPSEQGLQEEVTVTLEPLGTVVTGET